MVQIITVSLLSKECARTGLLKLYHAHESLGSYQNTDSDIRDLGRAWKSAFLTSVQGVEAAGSRGYTLEVHGAHVLLMSFQSKGPAVHSLTFFDYWQRCKRQESKPRPGGKPRWWAILVRVNQKTPVSLGNRLCKDKNALYKWTWSEQGLYSAPQRSLAKWPCQLADNTSTTLPEALPDRPLILNSSQQLEFSSSSRKSMSPEKHRMTRRNL